MRNVVVCTSSSSGFYSTHDDGAEVEVADKHIIPNETKILQIARSLAGLEGGERVEMHYQLCM